MSKPQTIPHVKQLNCEWYSVADKVQNFLRSKGLRKDDVHLAASAYDGRTVLVLIVYDEKEEQPEPSVFKEKTSRRQM